MPRDGEKVRLRLQAAAVKLIADEGFLFARTAQIAAAAGVTERTLFRHFPEKAEMLFNHAHDCVLCRMLAVAIEATPPDITPWGALRDAFRSIQRRFVEAPDFEARRAIVSCELALQQRDALRIRMFVIQLALALRSRGQPTRAAYLVARFAVATFEHAIDLWLDEPSSGLDACVVRAFQQAPELLGVSSVTGDTRHDQACPTSPPATALEGEAAG